MNAGSGDLYPRHVHVFDDDRLERRSRYVLLVERDIDTVIADLGRQVSDGARAVAVVAAIDGSLAWALDGDAEVTLASATGVDHELGRLVHHPVGEARPGSTHLLRVGAVHAGQSVRLVRYRLAAETDRQQVLAELRGREIDQVTLVGRDHVGLDAIPRRSRDRHLKVRRPARFLGQYAELLQAVHRSGWMDMDSVSNSVSTFLLSEFVLEYNKYVFGYLINIVGFFLFILRLLFRCYCFDRDSCVTQVGRDDLE